MDLPWIEGDGVNVVFFVLGTIASKSEEEEWGVRYARSGRLYELRC
jgi:hypothetical protein